MNDSRRLNSVFQGQWDEYRLRGVIQRSMRPFKTLYREDFEFHAYCRYDTMKRVVTGGLVTNVYVMIFF